ncbi:50S ribosomal protein L11 methyltransferase [Prevotella sp. KH2C16]|uniref:50S ribosomal protein L11 methyltransferase n=1 Tax=Prevotella sp. KH2C16 TaxID=1855325 RepID=UPI0008EF95BD|nr:50S ribosomal protein L11 methyltransferase [Prevotella sp. KH2C16]SFG00603.1 ribosomal protein L11 methyltransferase [Prevotella sp. KH2C16]
MKYIVADFDIRCDASLLQTCKDLLAGAAANAGFESFEETEDNHLKGYAQKDLFYRHALDEAIKDFPIKQVEISYALEDVEDKDWNASWEEGGFDPINIQDKILIFDAKQPLGNFHIRKSTIPIAIDAKLAFGTGTHQTTQMIVSTLLELDLEGKRVLDCGCGTGILSLAASKLGARECIAYDIDEWSVENTRHNAEINQVTNLTVFHGDGRVISHINGVFDIVMANINRNILLADMDKFKEVMRSSATLILSGFYEEDIPLLTEKAASLGLEETGRKTDDNWACLLLQNRKL